MAERGLLPEGSERDARRRRVADQVSMARLFEASGAGG